MCGNHSAPLINNIHERIIAKEKQNNTTSMDLPFSPSMIIEGGMDFMSACLDPNEAVTSPTTHSTAHQGKTRNRPTKGSNTSFMSIDLDAVANCFTLESVERYLNCVTLPVDPRSPNTRAVDTFSFTKVHEEGSKVVADSRQDSSHPRKLVFSERDATELSFMAEREAVMNGDRMTDEDMGNTLFQQWHRTGWSSNAFASTPRASNYFHFPTVLSPQSNDGGIPSRFEQDAKGTDTGDPATYMDVPGGLWSLASNDVSDDNETNVSASVSDYCNDDECDHYEGIEVEDEEEEKGEKVGKEEEDLVMMLRSPTNKIKSDSRSECQWNNVIVEGPKDDLLWQDINNVHHFAPKAANDDPIIAAQRALTQASYNCNYRTEEGNEEDDVLKVVSNETDGHYFLADPMESDGHYFRDDPPGLTDNEGRREAAKSSSSSSSTNGWDDGIEFQLRDEYNGDIHEESSLLPPVNLEQNSKVSEQHTPPRLAHELTTTEPKKYANQEEANRHFDEIFSSFELSLNRHVIPDDESPRVNLRDMERQRPSPNHRNRTKLSPLAAAAHKMKSQGIHKDTRQDEQHGAHRGDCSSNSSTFLESTVIGRKLNHRPSPPSSPAPSDTSKRLASSDVNASESLLDRAARALLQAKQVNHRSTPSPRAPSDTSKFSSSSNEIPSESIIDHADNPIFQANEHRSNPPSLPAPSDASKLLGSSDGNASERLIDRAKKTIDQANDTLESMEFANHVEMANINVPTDNIDYNVDEIDIDFEESCHQDEQLQDRSLEQSIAQGRRRGIEHVAEFDEDCPDDEKIKMTQTIEPNSFDEVSPNAECMVMRDFAKGSKDAGDDVVQDKMLGTSCDEDSFGYGEGNASFDSTVNWDGLNYSMSDNMSMSVNSPSLGLVNSPTFKSTNIRSISHATKRVEGEANYSAAKNANEPPISPRSSALSRVEDEQTEVIANNNNAHSGLQKQKQDHIDDIKTMSVNSPSLGLVNSPTFKSTNIRSISHATKRVEEEANYSAVKNANEPPISPRSSALSHVEDEQTEVIANNNNAHSGLRKQKQDHIDDIKSSTKEHDPITSTVMLSYLHKKKQVNLLSPRHGNDEWDSIEKIKRSHDQEIRNIRMIAEERIKTSSSPIVATSTSPKENVAPLSPNTSDVTTHHLDHVINSAKKHDGFGWQREPIEPMTPRSFDVNMQQEVQSRIDAMREQHRMNMDKMRNALEDRKDEGYRHEENHCGNDHATSTVPESNHSVVDEDKVAQCVGMWKWNAKRFDKAKERYSSWKTNIRTPTNHGERETRRHFKFDDSFLEKDTLSPKVKELMLKNEELEEEMRTILLSPKKSNVNEAQPSSPQHFHTPSSARYTTPRSVSHPLCTPSSARCTTPISNTGMLYQLHTILSENFEEESELGIHTGLITNVEGYLEKEKILQEHLLEELF